MTVPPLIQVVHAADAPQHLAELKAILARMKTDKRITDFIAHDVATGTLSIAFTENTGGVVVLLTTEGQGIPDNIENLVKALPEAKRKSLKLIEIIVDNIPYHDDFIHLPPDFEPVRGRSDMDSAWKVIGAELESLYPILVEPVKIVDESKTKTFFKLAIVAALAIAAFYIFISVYFFGKSVHPFLGIFFALAPFLVARLNNKNEVFFTTKKVTEETMLRSINFQKILIETGISLLVAAGLSILVAALLREQLVSTAIALTTVVAYLILKSKSKVTSLIVFFLLCISCGAIFWHIVYQTINNNGSGEISNPVYVVGGTFFTTLVLMMIRRVRARKTLS